MPCMAQQHFFLALRFSISVCTLVLCSLVHCTVWCSFLCSLVTWAPVPGEEKAEGSIMPLISNQESLVVQSIMMSRTKGAHYSGFDILPCSKERGIYSEFL